MSCLGTPTDRGLFTYSFRSDMMQLFIAHDSKLTIMRSAICSASAEKMGWAWPGMPGVASWSLLTCRRSICPKLISQCTDVVKVMT